MLIAYMKRDFTLTLRNIFVLLVFFFPIITALGATGIVDTFSTTPKLVILEDTRDNYTIPEGINVTEVKSEKELKKLVYDIDTTIGFLGDQLVQDGRENEKHVNTAKDILAGKVIKQVGLDQELFKKVLSFNLYGSLIFTGIILLFSLVEERANNTTELIKTHPVPPYLPIISKSLVVSSIISVDFLICSLLLDVPINPVLWLVVLLAGVTLGIILGLTLAFYATNETQALAILKPVSMVFLLAIPGLGFFLGGTMQTIALYSNPFYWLLELVNGLMIGNLNWLYVVLVFVLSILSLVTIAYNWHKTPYGIRKSI